MRHALIMAGGAGTRLWPLSRRDRPKQLLRLFDGQSLLRIARERLRNLFAPENTWVITAAAYRDQVLAELGDLPAENILAEPVGRDTANAIGLAANILLRRLHAEGESDATMAVFTADHLITPQERFDAALARGLTLAESHPAALVTFGIFPTSPHTGYGYIRRGEPLPPPSITAADALSALAAAIPAHRVREFREKPSIELAQEYVSSGEYAWNSGMFCWRVSALLRQLERLLPDSAARLARIAADWPGGAAAADFSTLPRISIDYAVLEKAAEVLTVEMKLQWLDLGSFQAVAATRPPDADGHVAIGAHALHAAGANNIAISEREHLIVTLGLSDVAIVHCEDATLVCRRDMLEQIKELAALRIQRFGERYE